VQVRDVFRGETIGPFTVLAPSQERYIHLIPDLDKTPTSYRESLGSIFRGSGAVATLLEKARTWVEEKWDVETLSNSPDPPTSASNETRVVQLGVIDGKPILLTADVGPVGLEEAADFAELLGRLAPPYVFQVPHHGSRRNLTPHVLDRWLGPRKPEGTVIG